jgi:5'-nucleotidase
LRILLTNDDGMFAPGIRALRETLKQLGDVTIVAPASEESGVGHSITLLSPLLVKEVFEKGEFIGFAVEGKPADCVKLGIVELFQEPPDLVVSGINAGSNAGINVLYSGTVAAAIEGAFYNITSIAVSLELADPSEYEDAAEIALNVIRQILDHRPNKGELFNVNIPDLSKQRPKGIRATEQGLVAYAENYEARIDPRNRRYYWLLPDSLRPGEAVDSDLAGLEQGYVTVTPLHFDLTAHRRLEQMRSWKWSL